MEDKLKRLLDFQRFMKNGNLEKLINETEDRFAEELSDDDLSAVSAAGELSMSGGTIDGNVSESGGGIYCASGRDRHAGIGGGDGGGGGGGGSGGGGSGTTIANR